MTPLYAEPTAPTGKRAATVMGCALGVDAAELADPAFRDAQPASTPTTANRSTKSRIEGRLLKTAGVTLDRGVTRGNITPSSKRIFRGTSAFPSPVLTL